MGQYLRRKKNASGTTSVYVLERVAGKNQDRFVKSFGSSCEEEKIRELEAQASAYIKTQQKQFEFDFERADLRVVAERTSCDQEQVLNELSPVRVNSVGPELLLGNLFDLIGFNKIREELFRDLVISRLVTPGSKLKTVDYLLRYKQKEVSVDRIYHFLDRFHTKHQDTVERISYEHTKRRVGTVSVVFYDMTTLYFEADDEDDLRKVGYSKDGKVRCPQIVLGLLVSEGGYPIGYDIHTGNTSEGKTLLPAINRLREKYQFSKPIVVADSGLLSAENIEELKRNEYSFILGARIKTGKAPFKKKILKLSSGLQDGESIELKQGKERLIVSYSAKRAYRDDRNRQRGLERLRKKYGGKKSITKSDINNKGYNKFLKIISKAKITVEIDNSKIAKDKLWDGLKGYITNSNLSKNDIIENYRHLWQIEKAFRISKTDLRIRPIYHREEDRIRAHISIAFVAYAVFKELEYQLAKKKIKLSPEKAIELTKTVYQLEFTLANGRKLTQYSFMTAEQALLINEFKQINNLCA